MITELATTSKQMPVALPLPSVNVTIRPGVLSDVPFLDSLQKLHTKQVGWMPTGQFEGKIKLGHVLIAESDGEPVGYCIGNDQYFKRDDVGIIYQMNVAPGKQRGFVGASLLKAQFERSAYGCKLYCCWCAQDLEANKFWEAMGFVALAFRTGSARKGKKSVASGQLPVASGDGGNDASRILLATGNRQLATHPRIHIFWQKRIRRDDATTPWWFPSKTAGGSIREDRIVLPIPPGVGWRDVMPVVLPGGEAGGDTDRNVRATGPMRNARPGKVKATGSSAEAKQSSTLLSGGLRFGPPATVTAEPPAVKETPTKSRREPRVKQKNDPRLVAAARELRDRWLDEVNAGRILSRPIAKYDVSRQIQEQPKTVEARLIAA